MYDAIMISVCNWCIDFLRKVAEITGFSYEENNVWLFIIIQPGLIVFYYLRARHWKRESKKHLSDVRKLIQTTLERKK